MHLVTDEKAAGNTRLAQWGQTSLIETLCFYRKFVLADSLVFQIPPLRQAWERYMLCFPKLRIKTKLTRHKTENEKPFQP